MNIVDSSGWLAYFADEPNARHFLTPLNDAATLAITASKLSLENNLPIADSIILATGREFNAILWTQDSDFKNINNVKYFPNGCRKR